MQLNDRVVAITQDDIVPGVVDQILDSNINTARRLQNTKKWNGESMVIPILSAKNANGGSFSGTDTFLTGLESNTKKMRFYPKAYYQNVSLGGIEKAVNKTPAQQAQLVAVQMHAAQNSMLDSLGTIFYGDGTGNSGKDFQGLRATTDDGSTLAVYGGLTRASNTYLNASVTTSVGTIALSTLKTMLRNASAASSTKQRPNIGMTTELVWDAIEGLFPTPQAQFQSRDLPMITATGNRAVYDETALKGATGYTALFYKATPIVADDLAPTGSFFYENEAHGAFYSLKDADLESVKKLNAVKSAANDPGSGVTDVTPVQWTGFQKPDNQYAMVGQLIIMGEYFDDMPRRGARASGITG